MSKKEAWNAFRDRIKDAINIVEIVSEHVVLRKSGSNFTGLCPFHNERSPSFSVSENKQLYHCYGCKKGGDVLSFYGEMHGLSFVQTLEELAERAKIALPAEIRNGRDAALSPEAQKQKDAARGRLELAQKVNRFAAAYYFQELQKNKAALDYLSKRGVQGEWIRQFYVGLALKGWDHFSKYLVQKKAPSAIAIELGLIRPSPAERRKEGPGFFDLFRNRAMFPILDLRGRVAGFGGRVLDKEDTPKYLNSPDSLLFHKSQLLYGLYQAQKHIRESDEVILVEGYFDVIVMHVAGFQNVVATCGTALSHDHLKLLRRLATRLTVLFDGDEAGQKATVRAMEMGLEVGWVFSGAQIPGGLDPDEVLLDRSVGSVLPSGIEKMKMILGGARPLLDEMIDQAIDRATDGPEARATAIKQIQSWLSMLQDPLGRRVRTQALSQRLGFSLDVQSAATHSQPQTKPQNTGQMRISSRPQARSVSQTLTKTDRLLLESLIFHQKFGELWGTARSKLPPNEGLASLFEATEINTWVHGVLDQPEYWERFKSAPETFVNEGLAPELKSVLASFLIQETSELEKSDVESAMDLALGRTWARFSQQLRMKLEGAEAKKDTGLREQLMKEFLDVQRRMKEFSNFYEEA